MPASISKTVIPELADKVAESAVFLGGACLGALLIIVACAFLRRRLGERLPRWAAAPLLIPTAGFGLYLAWQRLWLCDDAFITFRYSKNFAEGAGLVFNPGEWVEGYTNFLWTVLLGAAHWVGADIPLTGLFGNLAAFVAVLILSAVIVYRAGPGPNLLPLASMALAGSAAFTTYASSGLETMPAAMLVMFGVWLSTEKRHFLSGLAFVLAAMTRPDHILFWGCMGLAMAGEDVITRTGTVLKRLDWGRYLRFTAPLIGLYVPYFLWRWQAYGDLFPNTYYAKSGGSSYYAQGLIYGAVFLASSGAWLWLTGTLLTMWGRVRSQHELRLRIFVFLSLAIFGHYVVRVGGDFMANRFFVVIFPITLTLLEIRLRWLAESGGWKRAVALTLGALSISAAITTISLFEHKKKKWNLAAEYTFYRVKSLKPLEIDSRYFKRGQKIGKAFEKLENKPKMAAFCVGMIGYYSQLPLVDMYGLTNRRIAHKEVKRRGRPGHEKKGTLADARAEGAVLSTVRFKRGEHRKYVDLKAAGETLYLIQDAPELRKLTRGNKKLKWPRPFSPALKKAAEDLARDKAVSLMSFARDFAGPSDEGAVLALEERLSSVADFEDEAMVYTVSGDAPKLKRSKRKKRKKSKKPRTPIGVSGLGWLEFDGKGIRNVSFDIDVKEKTELRFLLGGTQSKHHRVELRVHKKVVQTIRPRTLRLLPYAFDVSSYDAVQLVIVDKTKRSKAMLRIDGIHTVDDTDLVAKALNHKKGSPISALKTILSATQQLPSSDSRIRDFAQNFFQRWWHFNGTKWPSDFTVEGKAFGSVPAKGTARKQQLIRGIHGDGFANSFRFGDKAMGKLISSGFTVPKKNILVRVAGGSNCKKTYVGLEVGGKLVQRVCGNRDEHLRTRTLYTRKWAGKPARLVIVDEGKGAWDHILVDDIAVPHADG